MDSLKLKNINMKYQCLIADRFKICGKFIIAMTIKFSKADSHAHHDNSKEES